MARYAAIDEARKMADKQLAIFYKAMARRLHLTHDLCAGCEQPVQKNWTYCPYCGAQDRADISVTHS